MPNRSTHTEKPISGQGKLRKNGSVFINEAHSSGGIDNNRLLVAAWSILREDLEILSLTPAQSARILEKVTKIEPYIEALLSNGNHP